MPKTNPKFYISNRTDCFEKFNLTRFIWNDKALSVNCTAVYTFSLAVYHAYIIIKYNPFTFLTLNMNETEPDVALHVLNVRNETGGISIGYCSVLLLVYSHDAFCFVSRE